MNMVNAMVNAMIQECSVREGSKKKSNQMSPILLEKVSKIGYAYNF